jgi:hypothetical protein
MVGTRLSQVGRQRSTSAHQRDTLKRRGMTMLPPAASDPTVVMHWPLMW